jgi:hypothetical protein
MLRQAQHDTFLLFFIVYSHTAMPFGTAFSTAFPRWQGHCHKSLTTNPLRERERNCMLNPLVSFFSDPQKTRKTCSDYFITFKHTTPW